MGDHYDDMTGPVLAEELARRELPVSGKVDELRARLREDDEKRAQEPQEDPDGEPAPEDTPDEAADVPEPRQPAECVPVAVVLTEEQARVLTAGEARLAQFLKHVTAIGARKYCAGDSVVGIPNWESHACSVLPYGVVIELERAEQVDDGLKRLRAANDALQEG